MAYTDQIHVLVVDDDQRIRDLVARYLHKHSCVVTTAKDAHHAEEIMAYFDYDVMVLDIMMPGEDGLQFAQRQIAAGLQIPILMLTAKGETEDRISGLETGVDDYLVKPFEPRELFLRLENIVRNHQQRISPDALYFGNLQYVFDTQELHQGEERIVLTQSEKQLMSLFGAQPNEILSREYLAEHMGMSGNERTIDVQINRLRKKIETDSKSPRYLQTVRGKGYILYTD